MCHPGFVDAELERLDPLTTLREREYAYLAGDAFPAAAARTASRWPDECRSQSGNGLAPAGEYFARGHTAP